MKNLLLVFVFVLISLTGFSQQTFTLSSYTPGVTQQTYTVSIPQGWGYNYLYTVRATNSSVMIVSQSSSTLASLSNPTIYQQQIAGSGIVSYYYDPKYPNRNKQYQDIIRIIIMNGASFCYGYGQIAVQPF